MANDAPIKTVILIPSQGDGVPGLLESALNAAQAVYGGDAIVYATKFLADNTVSFWVPKQKSQKSALARQKGFSTDSKNCSTFVYMGHSGEVDGPILAHDDGTLDVLSCDWTQPWHAEPGFYERMRKHSIDATNDDEWGSRYADPSKLCDRGRAFWSGICTNSRTDGRKIVVYGCFSGKSYTLAIAAVNKQVSMFGPMTETSPGLKDKAEKVLKAIEQGKTPHWQ